MSSHFPHGFREGVVISGLPHHDMVPGKVFWVGNNAVLLKNEKSASDANDGSFLAPYSTIDAAYNAASAGRNDVIFVRPGHTLSIADATTLVMDKASVHIVGLGHGSSRPTITFATATSAAIPITGVNNTLHNFLMVCDIANQNHMLDVAADDTVISACEFREGSATGLTFITADTADGDSDRLTIKNCRFYAPTNGNYDAAIALAKDFNSVVIENCHIYGDFDDAGISIPAGGNAQINLLIKRCFVDNLQTGDHAIEINGTGNTGAIVECYLQGDTVAAIVDTGGLSLFETYVHDKADQSYAIVTGTAVS